ncbi:MAG: serine protease [Candidatus Eisenbacteria bacterium]|uniref:Serine protease n=1 Tax=Eiseniibacteriota bacterium TaxID=2212470 RepID=A0A956NJB3_UNCEI|nr:serine protease [Candidatus Eisenbacteria bacterium]
MFSRRLLGALVCITFWSMPVLSRAGEGVPSADGSLDVLLSIESRLIEIAERIQPGVLPIRTFRSDANWYAAESDRWHREKGWQETENDDLRWQGYRPIGHASGFLIDEDGHIYTTRTSLLDPDSGDVAALVDVEIEPSIHEPARVVAVEPTLNLAILRVVTPQPLHPLEIGNSGKLYPGQWVFVFGDPEGPERTLVLTNIAYEPHRDCYQDELSATFLQTSTPVVQGAFGGPIVDLHGRVIGMSTSRGDSGAANATAPAGSGYGLPINLATAIYKSLLFRESRESPWLGISVLNLSHELRQRALDLPMTGIYIDNVYDPSPASRLGIEVGDVLVRMGEHQILTPFDFQRWLYWTGAGGEVELELVRNGTPRVVQAELEVRPLEATTR